MISVTGDRYAGVKKTERRREHSRHVQINEQCGTLMRGTQKLKDVDKRTRAKKDKNLR